MKFVCVALAVVVAACCCSAVEEIANDDVTHVVVGADQEGIIFQWKQNAIGYSYAEACFGETINVYQKRTSDINPATDTPYCYFDAQYPIYLINLTGNYYYGFFPVNGGNSGPNGINGALDIYVSTSYEKMNEMIPATPGNVVDMKISMNSGTATLSWESTGVDNTSIYRRDVPVSEYTPETWFPPKKYYMTGCSAKLWMALDEAATNDVKIQHPDQKYTGVTQVTGINAKTVSIVAVTTEKKDLANPFTRAYDFVALGDSASTTVLSSLALLLLLASVLLF